MNNQKITIPAAIIIAAVIIAGAIFIEKPSSDSDVCLTDVSTIAGEKNIEENAAPVNTEMHVLGNPEAKIQIVEYSDLECPYCKTFHATMHQIIDEYGKSGDVAWVYKHFPLDSLHSKARKEAEASECAAELGGNQGFWDFTDRLFEVTPSNNGLAPSKLPDIAEYIGLDRSEFEACLNSGKYADKIEENLNEGVSMGARGTPFSVMIAPDGTKTVINGAQPYSTVKQGIESVLETL